MPEQETNTGPFPLRTRLGLSILVRPAAHFLRSFLARPVSGRKSFPIVAAVENWVRLLTGAGRRIESWQLLEALEFYLQLTERIPGEASEARTLRTLLSRRTDGPAKKRRWARPEPPDETRHEQFEESSNTPAVRSMGRGEAFSSGMALETARLLSAFPHLVRSYGRQGVDGRSHAATAGMAPGARRPASRRFELVSDDRGFASLIRLDAPGTGIYGPLSLTGALSFSRSISNRSLTRGISWRGAVAGPRHPSTAKDAAPERIKYVHPEVSTEATDFSPSGIEPALPVVGSPVGIGSTAHWSMQAARSRGRPLDVMRRAILERSFPDLNLTLVRVHTDAPADEAAAALGADAFAMGADLFFRSGTFNPLTERGLALLTHELVHVRQTAGGQLPASENSRSGMEREALLAESMSVAPPSAAPGRRGWTLPDGAGTAARMRQPATKLDFFRSESAEDRTVGGNRQSPRSVPLERLAGNRPLTAETGRSAPAAEQTAGAAGAASGTEDLEETSRRVARALEQKIAIEKERRGIDRWVF